MELYKYTTAKNGINILTNLEIRFTQPNALNDVFEMFPNLLTDISEELMELLFKELEKTGIFEELWTNITDKFYTSMSEKYPFLFGSRDIADIFLKKLFEKNYLRGRSISGFMFDFIRKNPTNFKNQAIHQFIDLLNSNVGVLSLSESNDDNKLWSYYAASHTGIIICFDKENAFFHDTVKVKYVKNRRSINLNDIILKTPESNIQEVFYTKSIDWEFEKEYRKFGLFRNCKRKLNINDSMDNPIYLFDIPKEAICGVIMGSKTRREHKKQINDIIVERRYSIRLKQAFLSESDYQIEIR
jgi:hypothetical protein